MSILDFVPPSYTLRDNQPEILLAVEKEWKLYDVFVLVSDVGTGKSVILQTIARWQQSKNKQTATITPQVTLQEQYVQQFNDVPVLKGASRYECRQEPGLNCKQLKACEKFYCKGCVYVQAKSKALNSGNTVFNLHSYLLAQSPREVLLIDEAHMLFSLLSDLYSVSIWRHKYTYPENLNHYGEVLVWIERTRELIEQEIEMSIAEMSRMQKLDISTLAKVYREELKNFEDLTELDGKLANIFAGIEVRNEGFFIEHAQEFYRHKKMDMLKLRPRSLKGVPVGLFGDKTKKLVLATATMNTLDLDRLGLAHRRVKFLEFDSPLEAEDRPIQLEFVGNMAYKYQDKSIPALVDKIVELQNRHSQTKGIVHCTYALATKLQELLPSTKIIYHNQLNKEEKLEEFKKASPGTVFIASGMSMGIDLAGPDFGWQAVTKIMYPNQKDALVDEWYRTEPNWITWLTTKDLIQTCGRVNRYKGDKAITYILDSCFGNPKKHQYGLYQKANGLGLLPKYFKDRIKW